MKLSVKVAELKAALKKAKLTISPTDTNVVLQNFALRAEGGELTIVATDLQLATICVIQATIDKEGTTTIPGVKFLSMVDSSSADELSLETDAENRNISIRTGNYVAQLTTLSFDDYPRLEDFDEAKSVKTNREGMLQALNRISFSVSDNEAKRNLLAVYLNNGFMQATDGQVTTVVEFDKNFTDMLIPALAVKDLVRILKASAATEVELCATESFLLFRLGQDVFMTRLSTAKFPDIPKKLIKPTDTNNIVLTVDRLKLKAAVSRVGITASDRSLAVGFDIATRGTTTFVSLSSNDASGNTSTEELEATYNDPSPLKIFFNYTRLLDILNAVSTDTVSFRISSNKKLPIRIQEDSPLFICFIMRLSEQVLAQPVTPTVSGPSGDGQVDVI